MHRVQANLSTTAICQIFLDRFQVSLEQHPCALRLGFTHIVRFVYYDPRTPFTVYPSGYPFKSEDEATRFCKSKLNRAIDYISKFPEQERERLATAMLREDGKGNHEVRATYDALLLKYLPQLLPTFHRPMNPDIQPEPKPLSTPTVDVTRFCAKLSNSISKSLKAVVFFRLTIELKAKTFQDLLRGMLIDSMPTRSG
jgi:hypothetical protein